MSGCIIIAMATGAPRPARRHWAETISLRAPRGSPSRTAAASLGAATALTATIASSSTIRAAIPKAPTSDGAAPYPRTQNGTQGREVAPRARKQERTTLRPDSASLEGTSGWRPQEGQARGAGRCEHEQRSHEVECGQHRGRGCQPRMAAGCDEDDPKQDCETGHRRSLQPLRLIRSPERLDQFAALLDECRGNDRGRKQREDRRESVVGSGRAAGQSRAGAYECGGRGEHAQRISIAQLGVAGRVHPQVQVEQRALPGPGNSLEVCVLGRCSRSQPPRPEPPVPRPLLRRAVRRSRVAARHPRLSLLSRWVARRSRRPASAGDLTSCRRAAAGRRGRVW
jgi:hypothetical protein